MATTALILHRVDDYDSWREAYDSVDELRRQGGVTDAQVLRPGNGDGVVAVTHDFESPEAARAFLSNEDLKSAMERSGVDLESLEAHFLQRD